MKEAKILSHSETLGASLLRLKSHAFFLDLTSCQEGSSSLAFKVKVTLLQYKNYMDKYLSGGSVKSLNILYKCQVSQNGLKHTTREHGVTEAVAVANILTFALNIDFKIVSTQQRTEDFITDNMDTQCPLNYKMVQCYTSEIFLPDSDI